MRLYLAVGIGGAIGSLARLLVSLVFFPAHLHTFPYSSLFVNLTGAFLLSLLVFLPVVKEQMGPVLFVAFTTGLLGSYTTFSTIILEGYQMMGQTPGLAITYIAVTMIGGILLSFLGMWSAKHLSKRKEPIQ